MKKELFIDYALGNKKADLVIKNAKIVDVFCGKIIESDVAVAGGVIVGIGEYDGEREYDAKGMYLMPSFIDTHVHIESSMVTPGEYARAVMPRGVTRVVCDPHEIANVCGIDGILFMQENAKSSPMDFHFMLPSCVPCAEFEDSGASFSAEDSEEFFEKYDFLGLAEMMNYPGVVFKDKEVISKLNCCDITDGHAPSVTGKELVAYTGTGIKTDHECTSVSEMEEKLSLGMYVLLRCGRMSKDFSEMAKAVNRYNASRIAFCTDDRNIDDIIEKGTIQNAVVTAVSAGMDVFDAVRAASLNAALCYSLKNVGAVAPGYVADLVLAEELCPRNITAVWKNGRLVSENGVPLFDGGKNNRPDAVYNTVNVKPFTADELVCEFKPDIPVMSIVAGTLLTKKVYKQTKDGLSHLAVIERHKATGKIGRAYVENYGIKDGAIASCIGHDSHNITVIGDNKEDMKTAVSALDRDGGIAVVSKGEVKALLSLPVAGLMSDKESKTVSKEHRKAEQEAKALDINPDLDPLMTLAFLSLPVIPELKLTARGLFDVTEFKFI